MIRATRLIEHRFRLSAAARSAAGKWSERVSLLLVLGDGSQLGLGEAAPLPGFSADSLGDARDTLVGLLGRPLPDFEPSASLAAQLGVASAGLKSPAARAALEAALLAIWSRRAQAPAWSLLGVEPARRAPLAAWLPEGEVAALRAAESAFARGARAFKVKLDAARGLEEGVATLEALRRSFARMVTLRADANRSATLAELEPFLPRLRALELEWLEEPTAVPLSESIGVPLALDESLAAAGERLLETTPSLAALVLKPTALGFARCLELAGAAAARGIAAIASHALEGPVGFMAAATLALASNGSHAHGLGPHGGLHATRPPALDPKHDELVAWMEPGFGLELTAVLAGTEIEREYRP
jgi:o-succinylbenzoate synthase